MKLQYRGDLEGLRAVAVALPIVTHAFGVLPGGVLGVDIFFVLSGFFITSLLLRDLDRHGRINLRAFAVRRARRLAPLAVVVVLATVVSAAPMLLASARAGLFQNAVASLTGVENWHLMRSLANYQSADSGASPLQNFWSLAIEEQYYLLFPVVLAVIVHTTKRIGCFHHRRRIIGVTLVLVIVASIVYCWWRASLNPGSLYLDTVGRAWELALGGLVAVSLRPFGSMSVRTSGLLFCGGLALIAASAVLLLEDRLVPWPGAVPAALGTAMVIIAGNRAPRSMSGLLDNPPVRYIGRLSYALYLWHFPIIVMSGMIFGYSVAQGIAAVAVSVLLAVLSHHLIERPVRDSSWLSSVEQPRGRAQSARAIVLAPVLVLVVLVSGAAQWSLPLARDSDVLATRLGVTSPRTDAEQFSSEALTRAIARARSAPFDPAPIDSASMVHAETSLRSCVRDTTESPVPTVCSDAGPAAVRDVWLVGDSTAAAWADTIRAALPRDEWALHVVANAGCGVVDADSTGWTGAAEFPENCAARRHATLRAVSSARPDLVIISGTDGAFTALRSGADGSRARTEWQQATTRSLEQLNGHVRDVVFLAPPPSGADVEKCANMVVGLSSCREVEFSVVANRAAAEKLAAAENRHRQRTTVIDTLPWFCHEGYCPDVIDNTAVRADRSHISRQMASRLVELTRQRILDSLATGP